MSKNQISVLLWIRMFAIFSSQNQFIIKSKSWNSSIWKMVVVTDNIISHTKSKNAAMFNMNGWMLKRKYFNVLQVAVLILLDHHGSVENRRLLLLAKFINYFALTQQFIAYFNLRAKSVQNVWVKVHESKTSIKVIVFNKTLFVQFVPYSIQAA